MQSYSIAITDVNSIAEVENGEFLRAPCVNGTFTLDLMVVSFQPQLQLFVCVPRSGKAYGIIAGVGKREVEGSVQYVTV